MTVLLTHKFQSSIWTFKYFDKPISNINKRKSKMKNTSKCPRTEVQYFKFYDYLVVSTAIHFVQNINATYAVS